MKPIVPVVLLSAAAAPTRNEPCSSANTSDATLSSVDDRVDDREGRVGVVGRRLGDRVAAEEADADDEVVALVDETLRGARRGRRRRSGSTRSAVDAEFGGGLVESGAGSVVERPVAATGDVEHHADGAVALGRSVGAGGGLGAGGQPSVRLGARGASLDELASSSLPHAARPSAAMMPTASSFLLLIMFSPSG